MRAITIRQPWAQLILDGLKNFECRGYDVPLKLIGQRIAIHAGKNVDEGAAQAFGYIAPDMPTSAVVGTAVIAGSYDCRIVGSGVRIGSECDEFRVMEAVKGSRGPSGPDWPGVRIDSVLARAIIAYGRGPDGHIRLWWFTDIQPLKPIVPAKGHQGFWEWEQ